MFVRSALLISASEYSEPDIATLVAKPQDVDTLKGLLVDTKVGGFGKVQSMIEDDCQKLKQEIERFFRQREHHEVLLLYLSGFEILDTGEDVFFANAHTDSQRPEETALPSAFLQEHLKGCAARQKLLIVDCFARHPLGQAERDHIDAHLRAFTRSTQATILTSQDTLKTAYRDDGGKNPGFTETLMEGLRTGDADLDGRGYITENELFLYTYQRMNQFGTAPNLFLSVSEAVDRIRIASNIQYSTVPEMAQEDSSLNIGRFMNLWRSRKEVETEEQRKSLNKVLSYQPEVIFFRRLGWGLLISLAVGIAGSLLLQVALWKGTTLSLAVFVGLMIQTANNFKYRA